MSVAPQGIIGLNEIIQPLTGKTAREVIESIIGTFPDGSPLKDIKDKLNQAAGKEIIYTQQPIQESANAIIELYHKTNE